MNKRLQDKLFSIAPLLYSDKNLPMSKSCMYWGIAVGDGWYDLVHNLSISLEKEIIQWIAQHPAQCTCTHADWMHSENDGCIDCDCTKWRHDYPRAAQVKTKFGRFEFYLKNGTQPMRELVAQAQKRAKITCSNCGANKNTSQKPECSWKHTLCKNCKELA